MPQIPNFFELACSLETAARMMREEARVAASRNPTPLSQKRRGDSHKLRLFMSKMSQVMKERCGRPTGAVVVSRPVCRLVRVGREQAAAVESMLEADVDGSARVCINDIRNRGDFRQLAQVNVGLGGYARSLIYFLA
jgi:hypothetical protein